MLRLHQIHNVHKISHQLTVIKTTGIFVFCLSMNFAQLSATSDRFSGGEEDLKNSSHDSRPCSIDE